eukprot:6205454-Pleurochrysis_carterae.AAC.1
MGVTRTLKVCLSWPRRAMPRKCAEQFINLESIALECVTPQLTSPICPPTKLNVIALHSADRRLRA